MSCILYRISDNTFSVTPPSSKSSSKSVNLKQYFDQMSGECHDMGIRWRSIRSQKAKISHWNNTVTATGDSDCHGQNKATRHPVGGATAPLRPAPLRCSCHSSRGYFQRRLFPMAMTLHLRIGLGLGLGLGDWGIRVSPSVIVIDIMSDCDCVCHRQRCQ